MKRPASIFGAAVLAFITSPTYGAGTPDQPANEPNALSWRYDPSHPDSNANGGVEEKYTVANDHECSKLAVKLIVDFREITLQCDLDPDVILIKCAYEDTSTDNIICGVNVLNSNGRNTNGSRISL